MRNYYIDLIRNDQSSVRKLKAKLEESVSGKECIVLGSAPNPIFPVIESPCVLCVNGSVSSLSQYSSLPPAFTIFNEHILNNKSVHLNVNKMDYVNVTMNSIRNKDLGSLIIPELQNIDERLNIIKEYGISYGSYFILNSINTKLILSDVLVSRKLGFYRVPKISKGLVMAALSLWAGAERVILTGFSFNNDHAYSKDTNLTKRSHIAADTEFLIALAQSNYQIETTSIEISKKTGIPLNSNIA